MRCVLRVILLLTLAAPLWAQPMPTSLASIQEAFDQQHYHEALRMASRVLALRRLPDGFDRAALLSIKAESHLRLRQTPSAIHAFEELVEASEDPQARAVATATVALLKKSGNGQYAPDKPEGERDRPRPIDVIEPASRETALRAMADDELRPIAARVRRLRTAGRLPPMLELLQELRTIAVFERAATGSTEKADAFVAEVIEVASSAMLAAMAEMNAGVDAIEARAFAPPQDVPPGAAAVPPGLTRGEADRLQQIMRDAARIAGATESFARHGDALAAQSLQQIALDATALRDRASGVIRRDLADQMRRDAGRPRE